jgi:hypothetical protein
MPTVTVIYGEEVRELPAARDSLLGDVIIAAGLPLEQPCAGRSNAKNPEPMKSSWAPAWSVRYGTSGISSAQPVKLSAG